MRAEARQALASVSTPDEDKTFVLYRGRLIGDGRAERRKENQDHELANETTQAIRQLPHRQMVSGLPMDLSLLYPL